jgi:hypothetical protein
VLLSRLERSLQVGANWCMSKALVEFEIQRSRRDPFQSTLFRRKSFKKLK